MSPGQQTLPYDAPGANVGPSRGLLRETCEECDARLTGRQERWCSADCSARWYERERPRVTPTHTARVKAGSISAAVLDVMADGKFRTVQQLAEAVGALPASVSARLRELRAGGHRIVRDELVGNTRKQHQYRLVA